MRKAFEEVLAAPAEKLGNGSLPTIDLVDQVWVERHALRIAEMPRMQDEIRAAEEFLRNHSLSKTAEGYATHKNAVRMYSLYASQFALMNDPARPRINWWQAHRHEWFGVQWPGSQWGIDSPDNFYRLIVLDGKSRYEISGQRAACPPAQETFFLYNAIPSNSVRTIEGADPGVTLADCDMKFEADGSFVITVGPEYGQPGQNHLRSTAKAKFVSIRDTFSDWTTQRPNHLRVRRVDGPPAPPIRSDEAIAEEAAQMLKAEIAYWMEFFEEVEFAELPNTIPVPIGRIGGWGFLSTGWFKLRDDEAWVFTLHPLSAVSLGFQVSDVWGTAAEYIHHTSALNMSQCKPNEDGTYTFVVAPRDPGVWNWIDTLGMNIGMYTLRWQQLTDSSQVVDSDAILRSSVMKLDQLQKHFPDRAVWVEPDERKKQQEDRAASYLLRFTN